MSSRNFWTSINWNKVVVIFGLNWVSLSCGFTHGQMAGMIGALQKKCEGISLSDGQISLIAAFVNLSCIFGFAFLTVLGDKIGRRWCYIMFSIPSVINWVVLYHATTFTEFLLSRLLSGLSVGPLTLLNIIVTAEYCTLKSRGLHISIASVLSVTIGIGFGHIAGILIHWRLTALLGVFISIIHVFLPYFWMESPHWLALKGNFDECGIAFRKLHGAGDDSEHELSLLIKMESSKRIASKEMGSRNVFTKLLLVFKKQYFWDLLVMISFIYIYYAAAGKVIFSNLATVMIEDITGSSDVFLYTVLIDVFIFVGTLISFIFIKRTSVRVTLFGSGVSSIAILLILSASLYFKNEGLYHRWINVGLLCLYFIIIHAGPYPVMDILLGEMFPLELKLYCFFLMSPVLILNIFLPILSLPYVTSIMGYHGLFIMNSIIMSLCLLYFYIKLPETKGKTLQEIEIFFKTKQFDVMQVLNSNEQIKSLI